PPTRAAAAGSRRASTTPTPIPLPLPVQLPAAGVRPRRAEGDDGPQEKPRGAGRFRPPAPYSSGDASGPSATPRGPRHEQDTSTVQCSKALRDLRPPTPPDLSLNTTP